MHIFTGQQFYLIFKLLYSVNISVLLSFRVNPFSICYFHVCIYLLIFFIPSNFKVFNLNSCICWLFYFIASNSSFKFITLIDEKLYLYTWIFLFIYQLTYGINERSDPRGIFNTSCAQVRMWWNNVSLGRIWDIGPNFNILDNRILIVDKKMYSLIWVGRILVELFIKNHQFLGFQVVTGVFFNS